MRDPLLRVRTAQGHHQTTAKGRQLNAHHRHVTQELANLVMYKQQPHNNTAMFLHISHFSPKPLPKSSSYHATMHRVINMAHIRMAEYNRNSQTLLVEFSNGESRTFLNVDSSILSTFPSPSPEPLDTCKSNK